MCVCVRARARVRTVYQVRVYRVFCAGLGSCVDRLSCDRKQAYAAIGRHVALLRTCPDPTHTHAMRAGHAGAAAAMPRPGPNPAQARDPPRRSLTPSRILQ
jgi:poly(3-hydroxybutyrate) depolymerase